MSITITINTADGLSPEDIALLRGIHQALNPTSEQGSVKLVAAGGGGVGGDTVAEAAAKPAKPAKKAAPVKKAKDEEPEEAEEEADDTSEDDLRDTAVKLATEVVSKGGGAKVKAALGDHGAKRVSELKDDDLQSFIDAIS